MASRKRPARLRPKTPSRVKKRKRKTKRARGHQHPELVGLWLAALGLFLASVVYVGWNGGYCGYCDNCRRGNFFGCQTDTQITGVTRDGGYADYVIAPASAVALRPRSKWAASNRQAS